MSQTFGFICKPNIKSDDKTLRDALGFLTQRGYSCLLEEHLKFESAPALVEFVPEKDVGSRADTIVSMGGDGTLIRSVYLAQNRSPRVIGVARGSLGFLTEISQDKLLPILEKYLEKKCSTVERTKFLVELVRDGKSMFSSEVLNDVVIHKEALARILDLKTYVDDVPLTTFKADGLIISTPTGSTAYNMSAGGPILYPSVKAIAVTPICPHSLNYRPFIIPHDKKFKVRIPADTSSSFLTLNGQIGHDLSGGDEISIWISPYNVYTVSSSDHDYFQTLRSKLRWGER